ncbi:PREDICTED: unconventional myosin-Ic isoform X1 [Crocodylus porosus]|uniref:unconventional myosin-Ic isoform X1 n=1 Tax=Crocodylus porosus TaxID=8502 RepID=UPI000938B5DE|nr:PREDICTED: unconventional myosin-Ic isoform X1 [Crocodylus porosus]
MELQIEYVPTGEIIRVVSRNGGRKTGAGSNGIRMTMESALTARDRVGVQDFVLLENFTSEAAFIENLRKRFKENLIYTYIGSVLVSVNPYKELEIYSKQHMERYRGVSFYEVSPHLYAIADNSYRSLRTERKDQCILISGESGAGKTEATKKILQYYAVTCPASDQVEMVKDRLLQSNPVLEAFGNAKTLRNDNSSRFGKYMDVQFDYRGAPVGGHILNYLLEKSRVVHQNHGERNFHIFYQLLDGGEEELLRRLGLEKNPQQYPYLVKGHCARVSSINDKNDWKVVRKALSIINFNDNDVEDLLSIVASVLHLGNVQFAADEQGNAQVTTENQIKYLARLLGVEGSILREALIHKKIIAKGEELVSPLNLEQAAYARDALAKAVYGRTFSWLVNKINKSLSYKETEFPGWRSTTVLGLLDIYGFEVFQHNSFEQFCINYCNEKLQQLFIELTLKSEQEEYESEGIAWEPVQYFDNKIICDLVEEKFKGIISILDEECLRPGDATDMTFLEKLEETVKNHPHFLTHKLADQKTRKSLGREEFRLLHYAGEVTYSVSGFLDKNNDLLFRNLKETMCNSENPIVNQCFERTELTDKKRPETAATQFKNSLSKLMEILMSKEPSYIRCIKPNDSKQAGQFVEVLIRHQVKYLGLMENLRVRRAGFAYRRKYEVFLQRYKSLCPETWPVWDGRPHDGVAVLVKYLGYKQEEYKMGRTKIFIRFPKTLFATEDALEIRKQSLATKIQAAWRGFHQRQKFQHMKHSAITIQSWWRGTLGRRKAAKKKWAVETIRRFIKGFIYRNYPRCAENEYFLDYIRYSFLMSLKRNLPRNVLDKSWPTPPPSLCEASQLLRQLCMQNMVWRYCKRINPEWKQQLDQKVIASEIFKDKKDNYPQSVPRLFLDTRLVHEDINAKVLQALGSETIKYAVPVIKYDRKGYKARARQLLLTQTAVFIVEEAKIKQRIDYANLTGISVSSLSDNLFVLHVHCEDNKQKGDVVLQSDHAIETLTKMAMSADKVDNVNINQGSIKFTVGQGKEGIIDFTSGSELLIAKAKNGHLTVVAPRLNSR